MTNDIRFDVDGRDVAGALAEPAGEGKHGAVVVVHEWHGLNREIREKADRFASEGFLALAVDLFGGEVTDRDDRAAELATRLKTADAIEIVGAAVRWLKANPRSNGKVAVTGFCLGGAMTLAAAANVEGLSAAVPFYGTPRDEFLHVERMTMPILGHYAKQDSFVDPARAKGIAEKVNASGGSYEIHFYDGGHAFMRNDPKTFHAESAKVAWARTVDFLRKTIG